MASLTRFVLAHRVVVALAWLAVTVAALAALPGVSSRLSNGFALPGMEGFETNQEILRTYGTGWAAPLVPVVTLPTGTSVDSARVQAEWTKAVDDIAAAVPNARVASYATTRNPAFISADGRTTFALVYYRGEQSIDASAAVLPAAREAISGTRVAGSPVRITGIDALRSSDGSGNGLGVLVEVLLGAVGALLILLFVFGSGLAFVPLLIALVSIPTTFLLIGGLTTLTDVSAVVQFLVALIGLGVSIDFALLIVMRWREYRASGLDSQAAVQRAMATAGRAVVFSGTTVAVSLLALVAIPVPFLRSVGYGGMLIPLVSVAAAITLLPVILSSIGPALDRHRWRHSDGPGRGWDWWARLVVRRRWAAAAAGLALPVALIIPALSLSPGEPEAVSLASQGEAYEARVDLETSGVGVGVLTPFEALLSAGQPDTLARGMASVDGVRGAVAPEGPQWRRQGTSIVEILPAADGSSPTGEATLGRVRDTARSTSGEVRIGGLAAESADFVDAIYGSFPLMLGLIVLVTFVLLTRAFRSVVLPLKAVAFNLVSLGAVYGALVLVWQRGYGSRFLWGIEPTGSVTPWIPLMVFAFLFGLSMDYEVFILSRMREEYDASGSADAAVIQGISRTGRLVTSAGLILFLAFVALAGSPGTDIKMFATGLAIGILLDATIVRALLLPATVAILGRWSWHLPRGLGRVLRVEAPSAAAPAPG